MSPVKKRATCFTREELLGIHDWTPTPLAISRSPKLSFGAKMLYGEYMSWAYKNSGVCRPPQAVVAWHMNVTVRQVRRYQDELAEARAIVVVHRKSAKNASKPNKILFCKSLKHLCEFARLANAGAIFRPAMAAEEARKKGTQQNKGEDVSDREGGGRV